MLLTLIAAALQVAPPAPPAPPPPAIVPVPTPPIVRMAPPELRNRPPVTFQVRVTAGGERLIDERLRVGFPASASINRSRQEALDGNCPGVSGALNSQLSLSLRPDFLSGEPGNRDRFRLELRYSRPVQQACNSGSLGIVLEQQFALEPGEAATFTGDGGVRVELRRE